MFEARELDLTLELRGKKNTETGNREEKSFKTKEPITAEFSEKIISEMTIYLESQKSIPEDQRDKLFISNLKFLSWMYKDFDVDWTRKNFNAMEINDIKNWAFQGLMGVKKEDES